MWFSPASLFTITLAGGHIWNQAVLTNTILQRILKLKKQFCPTRFFQGHWRGRKGRQGQQQGCFFNVSRLRGSINLCKVFKALSVMIIFNINYKILLFIYENRWKLLHSSFYDSTSLESKESTTCVLDDDLLSVSLLKAGLPLVCSRPDRLLWLVTPASLTGGRSLLASSSSCSGSEQARGPSPPPGPELVPACLVLSIT